MMRSLAFTLGQALLHYSQRPQVIPQSRPELLRTSPRDQEWQLALIVFSLWYDRYHLSYNEMVRAEIVPGFVTREAYEICSDWLVGAGVIVKRERHRTRYRGAWNRARLVRYLRMNLPPLPYPEELIPPCLITPAQITHSTDHRSVHRWPPLRALAN